MAPSMNLRTSAIAVYSPGPRPPRPNDRRPADARHRRSSHDGPRPVIIATQCSRRRASDGSICGNRDIASAIGYDRAAMRKLSVLALVLCLHAASGHGQNQPGATSAAAPALALPTFHHIHLNSVNPERSLAWYEQYWPKGRKTTFAGFPAYSDGKGFYLLYTKVAKQAPGAFSRSGERSVPQSAFWTFGSTFEGPNLNAVLERLGKLDRKDFELVTLFGGSDGKQTATHSLTLPMGGQLLTGTAIRERAGRGQETQAASGGLDFAYVVDRDGMLVEVTSGNTEGFRAHTHFWGERPLCTANWHVDHLGAQFPTNQNAFNAGLTFKNGRWDPCDVPAGEVTYPPSTPSRPPPIPPRYPPLPPSHPPLS